MGLSKSTVRASRFNGVHEKIIVKDGIIGSTAVCEPEQARKYRFSGPIRLMGEKAKSLAQAYRIAKALGYPVNCQQVFKDGNVLPIGKKYDDEHEMDIVLSVIAGERFFRQGGHLVIRAAYPKR